MVKQEAKRVTAIVTQVSSCGDLVVFVVMKQLLSLVGVCVQLTIEFVEQKTIVDDVYG